MSLYLNSILAFGSLIVITPCLSSAYAAPCEVHSVKRMVGSSDSLRPNIEQILTNKGYHVVRDGYLYESYDVLIDDLKVRQDLLKPGQILALFSGEASFDDNVMCSVGYETMFCTFSFELYRVTDTGNLRPLAEINRHIQDTPSFFHSADQIGNDFMNEILTTAQSHIPECNAQ